MIVAFVEHDISAKSANYFECAFPIGSPGLKSGPAFLVAPATRRDHREMPRLIGTLSERYTKDNSRSRIEHGAYYRVVSPSWCVENSGREWEGGRREEQDEERWVKSGSDDEFEIQKRQLPRRRRRGLLFRRNLDSLFDTEKLFTSALQICQLSRDKSRGI